MDVPQNTGLSVSSLPVLAEEACQHVSCLQLFIELNGHEHFAELWRLDTNETLRTLLVVDTERTRG